MKNWVQINYANGDVIVINTSFITYVLKGANGLRKIGRSNAIDSVTLGQGDTVSMKSQAEVEGFLGGAFAKLSAGDNTFFVPLQNVVAINIIGGVIGFTLPPSLNGITADAEVVSDEDVSGEL